MGNSLCMTRFVYGWHEHFIPVYVYSVLRAYPDYFVKLFLHGELQPCNEELLDLVRGFGCENFQIIQNYFSDADEDRLYCLNWFIPGKEFSDFDYVYCGDIDFIVCEEEPGILEVHKQHCEDTGLPYSNAVRRRNWKQLGLRELTGLHFVRVPDYYEEVDPLIAGKRWHKYDRLVYRLVDRVLAVFGYGHRFSEPILHDLVSDAFGPPPEDLLRQKWCRPHHGIHLGELREEDSAVPPHRLRKWVRWWGQIEDDEGFDLLFSRAHPRVARLLKKLQVMMRDR